MTDEWTILLAVLGAWAGLCLAFCLGCAWQAWQHECRPVDIHQVDAAYQRGRADERAEREEQIRSLDRTWSQS
jgi:hypothetical protein